MAVGRFASLLLYYGRCGWLERSISNQPATRTAMMAIRCRNQKVGRDQKTLESSNRIFLCDVDTSRRAEL